MECGFIWGFPPNKKVKVEIDGKFALGFAMGTEGVEHGFGLGGFV